jgi:hydroxymethylpyrimidine pyrophosphatase-like HAD family hydrolase
VQLRPRTKAAIAAVRAEGIHVVIVTGRMFQSVRRYALEAGIDDPVVCYQGAVVAEPVTGRWLRHEPIPLELARETIAAVNEDGFGLTATSTTSSTSPRSRPKRGATRISSGSSCTRSETSLTGCTRRRRSSS